MFYEYVSKEKRHDIDTTELPYHHCGNGIFKPGGYTYIYYVSQPSLTGAMQELEKELGDHLVSPQAAGA